MNHDTRWLTRLAIEQGLLTRDQALQVRAKLGDADLMTFAQELIDSGIVSDVEKLEQIAGLALTKAQEGPPTPTIAPFGNGNHVTTHEPKAPASAGTTRFAFETAFTLEDSALAAGMRNLLKETASCGAS